MSEASEPAPLEVIGAARRGERQAWERLLAQYQPAVTAYCLTCARGRRDVALDWTQDIFSLAVENLGGLSNERNFQGWLFAIARNHCLRQGKRDARAQAFADDMTVLATLECDTPAEVHERQAWLAMLEQATLRVEPAAHRDVVRAHYGYGEKTRQIAKRLSIPHGTVTVILKRFRDRLKLQLLKEGVLE